MRNLFILGCCLIFAVAVSLPLLHTDMASAQGVWNPTHDLTWIASSNLFLKLAGGTMEAGASQTWTNEDGNTTISITQTAGGEPSITLFNSNGVANVFFSSRDGVTGFYTEPFKFSDTVEITNGTLTADDIVATGITVNTYIRLGLLASHPVVQSNTTVEYLWDSGSGLERRVNAFQGAGITATETNIWRLTRP